MKLYYLPGSCALGPHVALEYTGLAYEAVRVERGRQTDPAYLAINPLGRVPTLVTATHGTITEAPIVLTYIADVATGHGLLPAVGTPERYDAPRCMAYVRLRCILLWGGSGGPSAFATARGARVRLSVRQRRNWPMISPTSEGTCQTGSGLQETTSRWRISIFSSSDAWVSGCRRAPAIFRTSIATRWRLQAFRRHNVQ